MPAYRRVAPSVFITDIDRALRFYVDTLGFSLEGVDDPPRRVVVTQPLAVLHLDVVPTKAGSSSIHILVDDLNAVYQRATDAAVTVVRPPTDQPWGLREMIVADPDGNVFEIAEPIK